MYSPDPPTYAPSQMMYSPDPPTYAPSQMMYTPAQPTYAPSQMMYTPAQPTYASSQMMYTPAQPTYASSAQSPIYSPSQMMYPDSISNTINNNNVVNSRNNKVTIQYDTKNIFDEIDMLTDNSDKGSNVSSYQSVSTYSSNLPSYNECNGKIVNNYFYPVIPYFIGHTKNKVESYFNNCKKPLPFLYSFRGNPNGIVTNQEYRDSNNTITEITSNNNDTFNFLHSMINNNSSVVFTLD
jgi:hypothetical protein